MEGERWMEKSNLEEEIRRNMNTSKGLSSNKVFAVSVIISVLWAVLSYALSYYWFLDLTKSLGSILTFIVITGIAIVPGFLNVFLISSLIFDKNRPKEDIKQIMDLFEVEPITILVPAYNEAEDILNTLNSIAAVSYEGQIDIIVINNNSTDQTAEKCRAFIDSYPLTNKHFILIDETQAGKNFALNSGLKLVDTKLVMTIDADTVLHPDSITYIVSKINSEANVGAVAGCILVGNPKQNLMTRIQDWDYYISINAIKRCQGEYRSTLVAQGAFSIYQTDLVKQIGGWQDSIGEDIVLSWDILKLNKKVLFEPLAISYTKVPSTLPIFLKQRARWARGMIEAIKQIRPWKQGNYLSKFISSLDLLIPYVDFSYTFFWLPGVIVAILFQNYIFVGLFTILVLPLSIITFSILYMRVRYYYQYLGVDKRHNVFGIVMFIMFYQVLMSPVSIWGYTQETFSLARVWK